MTRELRERVLAELRAIAAEPFAGDESSLGQPDDVVLLLQPVRWDEDQSGALSEIIDHLAEKNFFTGAQAIGRRGIAGALLPRALVSGSGFHLDLDESVGADVVSALCGEPAMGSRALVTTRPKAHLPLANFVDRRGMFTAEAIGRVTRGDLRIRWMGETVLELSSCGELLR